MQTHLLATLEPSPHRTSSTWALAADGTLMKLSGDGICCDAIWDEVKCGINLMHNKNALSLLLTDGSKLIAL